MRRFDLVSGHGTRKVVPARPLGEGVEQQARGAEVSKGCESAYLFFRLAARLFRPGMAFPPHPGDAGPVGWLEGFLGDPVAGIGTAAASSSVAEIGLAVFLLEVIVENVERRLRRVILANPEIAIGLDVKEKLAG